MPYVIENFYHHVDWGVQDRECRRGGQKQRVAHAYLGCIVTGGGQDEEKERYPTIKIEIILASSFSELNNIW